MNIKIYKIGEQNLLLVGEKLYQEVPALEQNNADVNVLAKVKPKNSTPNSEGSWNGQHGKLFSILSDHDLDTFSHLVSRGATTPELSKQFNIKPTQVYYLKNRLKNKQNRETSQEHGSKPSMEQFNQVGDFSFPEDTEQ